MSLAEMMEAIDEAIDEHGVDDVSVVITECFMALIVGMVNDAGGNINKPIEVEALGRKITIHPPENDGSAA